MTAQQLPTSKIIVISGPTASGKSWLAERLSEKYPAVIINADSMQVYQELPVLSAQPDGINKASDVQQAPGKYKLYSVLDFTGTCSAGLWASWANTAIEETLSAGKLPIIVGGSGLYLRALLEGIADIPPIDDNTKAEVANQFDQLGAQAFHEQLMALDPTLQGKIHINDTYRMQRAMHVLKQTGRSITSFGRSAAQPNINPCYRYLHVHLNQPRELLYRSCDNRFAQMLLDGALEEVQALAEKIRAAHSTISTSTQTATDDAVPFPTAPTPFNIEKTLGYKQLLAYLNGQSTLEHAITTTQQLTRNYAKRQCTWFSNQFPNKTVMPCEPAKLEQAAEHLRQVAAGFLA